MYCGPAVTSMRCGAASKMDYTREILEVDENSNLDFRNTSGRSKLVSTGQMSGNGRWKLRYTLRHKVVVVIIGLFTFIPLPHLVMSILTQFMKITSQAIPHPHAWGALGLKQGEWSCFLKFLHGMAAGKLHPCLRKHGTVLSKTGNCQSLPSNLWKHSANM